MRQRDFGEFFLSFFETFLLVFCETLRLLWDIEGENDEEKIDDQENKDKNIFEDEMSDCDESYVDDDDNNDVNEKEEDCVDWYNIKYSASNYKSIQILQIVGFERFDSFKVHSHFIWIYSIYSNFGLGFC